MTGDIIDNTALFIDQVSDEVYRAREKFPAPNCNLAALTEEVGELAKALLELRENPVCPDDPEFWNSVWNEAVQVGAMACRVATEGDPTIVAMSPPTAQDRGEG